MSILIGGTMFKQQTYLALNLLLLSFFFTSHSTALADQTQNDLVNVIEDNAVPYTEEAKSEVNTLEIEPPSHLILGDTELKIFKKSDSNNDEKISLEEFLASKEQQRQDSIKDEVDGHMKSCDKNKDGRINLNELEPEEITEINAPTKSNNTYKPNSRCIYSAEQLEAMDINKDLVLTKAEMIKAITEEHSPNKQDETRLGNSMLAMEVEHRKQDFLKCDVNSDEILTFREAFSTHCNLRTLRLDTETFDAHDADNDGILTIDELGKKVNTVDHEQAKDLESIARRKAMPNLYRLEMALEECDRNKDGRLGKEETIDDECEQDLTYFDTVDNDQNGYITGEEMQEMREVERFKGLDENNNGMLDIMEYKSYFDAFRGNRPY